MAPLAKVAVNVAMSSFSTGPVVADRPAGGVADRRAQRDRPVRDHRRQHRAAHARTGPHRNSPTSTRWVPMSASAPDPARPYSAS